MVANTNDDMEIKLEGKRALVGGCTSGIGRAVALQLAESGASVVLMARDHVKLESLRDLLVQDSNQQHEILQVDFNDLDDFKSKIGLFLEEYPIDILVNNTQGPPSGGVLEVGIADYQQAFNLLFQTVVYTTSLVIRGMQERGFGRIINIASRTVREPLPHLALSNSIRSAMVSWAKTMSREVASSGITVNSILTGYFDTERLNQLFEGQARKLNVESQSLKENAAKQVPAGRFGRPEEFGYLVAFLASEQAAYINGASIPIDGGMLQSI
jgi:3-oxoacyl-[acyl-carrier protein] reductase